MKEIRARVVLQQKGLYKISYEGMENFAEVSGKFRFDARTVSDYPAVGDYVIASWPEDGSHSIISMLFPRKTCFLRKAAGTRNEEQVVAANIDTLFLCMSLNNDFNIRRMERYLATAWDSGATPVILLTKKDLCEDVSLYTAQCREIAGDVDILTVSSLEGSIEEVTSLMEAGKTYAFIGSSGVGKSTLINKLTGLDAIRTDGLRNDDKGHHTTTHRELISLPGGAYVIDTPGMRELGMFDHQEGIEMAFSEIEELARKCRFSDCSHSGEPGCAIEEAIEDGILSRERFEAYQKLSLENAYAADQSGYLKAKEAKFKAISKSLKHQKKRK